MYYQSLIGVTCEPLIRLKSTIMIITRFAELLKIDGNYDKIVVNSSVSFAKFIILSYINYPQNALLPLNYNK